MSGINTSFNPLIQFTQTYPPWLPLDVSNNSDPSAALQNGVSYTISASSDPSGTPLDPSGNPYNNTTNPLPGAPDAGDIIPQINPAQLKINYKNYSILPEIGRTIGDTGSYINETNGGYYFAGAPGDDGFDPPGALTNQRPLVQGINANDASNVLSGFDAVIKPNQYFTSTNWGDTGPIMDMVMDSSGMIYVLSMSTPNGLIGSNASELNPFIDGDGLWLASVNGDNNPWQTSLFQSAATAEGMTNWCGTGNDFVCDLSNNYKLENGGDYSGDYPLYEGAAFWDPNAATTTPTNPFDPSENAPLYSQPVIGPDAFPFYAYRSGLSLAKFDSSFRENYYQMYTSGGGASYPYPYNNFEAQQVGSTANFTVTSNQTDISDGIEYTPMTGWTTSLGARPFQPHGMMTIDSTGSYLYISSQANKQLLGNEDGDGMQPTTDASRSIVQVNARTWTTSTPSHLTQMNGLFPPSTDVVYRGMDVDASNSLYVVRHHYTSQTQRGVLVSAPGSASIGLTGSSLDRVNTDTTWNGSGVTFLTDSRLISPMDITTNPSYLNGSSDVTRKYKFYLTDLGVITDASANVNKGIVWGYTGSAFEAIMSGSGASTIASGANLINQPYRITCDPSGAMIVSSYNANINPYNDIPTIDASAIFDVQVDASNAGAYLGGDTSGLENGIGTTYPNLISDSSINTMVYCVLPNSQGLQTDPSGWICVPRDVFDDSEFYGNSSSSIPFSNDNTLNQVSCLKWWQKESGSPSNATCFMTMMKNYPFYDSSAALVGGSEVTPPGWNFYRETWHTAIIMPLSFSCEYTNGALDPSMSTATYSNTNKFQAVYPMFGSDAVKEAFASTTIFQLSVSCFKEGTEILCRVGNKDVYIPVEDLKTGYMVKTYKRGYRSLVSIGSTDTRYVVNDELHDMYKLSMCDSSDLTDDLYLTGGHSILVDELTEEEERKMREIDWPEKFYKIEDKFKLLASYSSKMKKTGKKGVVFNFVLDQDEVEDGFYNYGIYANGMIVETCNRNSFGI